MQDERVYSASGALLSPALGRKLSNWLPKTLPGLSRKPGGPGLSMMSLLILICAAAAAPSANLPDFPASVLQSPSRGSPKLLFLPAASASRLPLLCEPPLTSVELMKGGVQLRLFPGVDEKLGGQVTR